MTRITIATITLALIAGCANIPNIRETRDAPWDPKPGQGNLFDQIPAWDNASERICCGRNIEKCKPYQSPRC
jgi:hypothetical protein